MVQEMEQEQDSSYKSRFFNFIGRNENGPRHGKTPSGDASLNADYSADDDPENNPAPAPKQPPPNDPPPSEKPPQEQQQPPPPPPQQQQQTNGSPNRSNNDKNAKSRKEEVKSDMDLMKEKFAKLLLGEDMSGGGKGVSSALALSNAITNLAASVFGEQRRLEPMQPEGKSRWKKEIGWLLSVTDYIVELVPTKQNLNGVMVEVMTTKQRTDLQMNIPALRKLDTMLVDCLDNFKDQKEFYYASKDADDKKRKDDKWWLPTVKVPPEGLSESTRKWIQVQKDSVNQVLKAAMAINAQVLSEMEIPENYIESLPKNGRESLGDLIYRSITVDHFDPGQLLSTMDLTNEHKILDLKNRIEASIIIWKRKMNQKDGKSSWSSGVSLEKRELFEDRAETMLLLLKHRFPGLPQSSLDISKIQYNRDVGQAILESYSRILESLAYTVLSRIEDVLNADHLAKNPPPKVKKTTTTTTRSASPQDDTTSDGAPTLLDFMGWNLDQPDADSKDSDDIVKDVVDSKDKTAAATTPTNLSYIQKIEAGVRSPTARD